MKLMECINKLNLELVNSATLERDFHAIYIGDLLSMVMRKADEETLWLTVQTHVNAIAVAEMLDFSGIVFVEGLLPDEEAKKKASELDIPLLTTSDDAYTLAKKLSQLGI